MSGNFFEYTLTSKVSESFNTLVLYAPTNRHLASASKLESMLSGGQYKTFISGNSVAADATPPASEVDVTASDYITMLKIIDSESYTFYPEFCKEFRALILSTNICKTKENNQGLTEGYYDNISISDNENIMGEYIKNFFIK